MGERLIISVDEDIEDEDDESSNLFSPTTKPVDIEAELAQFRKQWHDELRLHQLHQPTQAQGQPTLAGAEGNESQPSPRKVIFKSATPQPSIEEQARFLFIQGINAEQDGKLSEAIQYYRRATQLVPDIEFKVDEFKVLQNRDRFVSESSQASDLLEEDEDLGDLMTHFLRLRMRHNSAICEPEVPQRFLHISSLPVELLMYIFKWVVSTELDVFALEQLSMVSRGFYICARDEELWKLVCLKIWGKHCGNPGAYELYRKMYIGRSHLLFNGCYISRSSYYRQGERGLDNYYRPFHLVEYYRYVRFFPEGTVIMLPSPDDPYTVVPKLRQRGCKIQGLLKGYYRVVGDRISIVMKRQQMNDYGSAAVYKYKRLRQQQQQQNNRQGEEILEQTFHAEFVVCEGPNKKANSALLWQHYSVHTILEQEGESVADFELTNKTYPKLIFSRVKSYTSTSEYPLH